MNKGRSHEDDGIGVGIGSSGFGSRHGRSRPSRPRASRHDRLERAVRGDLSEAIAPQGVWSITDGVLTASEDQNIWTKKQYENFVLDLEFKTAPGTNSGVVIYATEIEELDPQLDRDPDCRRLFGAVGQEPQDVAVRRDLRPAGGQQAEGGQKAGRVEPDDDHVQRAADLVMLNGELVTEMDMSKWTSATKNPDGSDQPEWLAKKALATAPTKGHIGLQGKHAARRSISAISR